MPLSLRLAQPEDVDSMLAWVGDERRYVQWGGAALGWPIDAVKWAAHLAAAERPHKRVFTAIEAPGDHPVGHIELVGISEWQGVASVGRVLVDPAREGQGIAQFMIEEVLRIAFDELGLHRLELRVAEFNASAIHVYEKRGFRREGLVREGRRAGDERWSSVQMSILEPEYRAIQ